MSCIVSMVNYVEFSFVYDRELRVSSIVHTLLITTDFNKTIKHDISIDIFSYSNDGTYFSLTGTERTIENDIIS